MGHTVYQPKQLYGIVDTSRNNRQVNNLVVAHVIVPDIHYCGRDEMAAILQTTFPN